MAKASCPATPKTTRPRLFEQHRRQRADCAGNWMPLKACELDPDMAWRINVDGVRNLISQSASGFALRPLVDRPGFSGAGEGGHVEDDATDPVTVYGKTMVAAERAILDQLADACILRISLPMGVSFNGHAGVDRLTSRLQKPAGHASISTKCTPTYTDCFESTL